jgi:hypothetical protein
VASPDTIKGLWYGYNTIYLRAVDKDGDVDRTPAKWSFDVFLFRDDYSDKCDYIDPDNGKCYYYDEAIAVTTTT